MITNVYIDGFNLYYGALKNTSYKWLDLDAMCRRLLPAAQHDIQRVRYFTAKIKQRPNDPQGPQRQQAYLRALGTLPTVSVHLGSFLVKPVRMPLADPPATGSKTVEVIKTEEKGSDVNLATYLLADAFRDDAETFVLVSNDSDLTEPMRVVRHELGKTVGILNPQKRASRALQQCQPTFTKQIRGGVLASSQLPGQLSDQQGVIHKPTTW